MKFVIGLQVFLFFAMLAGMLSLSFLNSWVRNAPRNAKLKRLMGRAYDICVSVLVADGVIALLTLSVLGIAIMFS